MNDLRQEGVSDFRPVVHIGYHKTATTWFQKAFYPAVTNARFIPRAAVREALLDVTAFKFDPDEARAAMGIGEGDAVTICEEGLSGYLHNGGMAGHLSREMAFRIREVWPDAQIVVFIRSQPAIIAASYQQYVRGGGTFSIRRYLFPETYLKGARGELAKAPRFLFDHYEFGPLIEHYRAVFGADNVHVFPYEAFARDRLAFLDDFRRRLGLHVDVNELRMRSSNRSYSVPTMWIVRLLNHLTSRTVIDKHYLLHIPFWYGFVRGVGEVLNMVPLWGRSPSSRTILGRAVQRWIEQRYWRSNRDLMDATGLPLDQYGYPMSEPSETIEKPGRPRWLAWLGN
jgi:hypothetical protein